MHVSEWRWLAQMSGGQQAAGKEPTKASGVSRSLAGGASPPPFSSIFLPLFDPVCLFCSILFHYLNTCAYFPFFAIIWSPVPFLFHLFPLFRLLALFDLPCPPFLYLVSVPGKMSFLTIFQKNIIVEIMSKEPICLYLSWAFVVGVRFGWSGLILVSYEWWFPLDLIVTSVFLILIP